MTLALLRRETGPLHKALEEKLQLFQKVKSMEDYVDHLSRLHQWLSPLEQTISGMAKGLVADWPRRQKCAWIEEDLAALGSQKPAPLAPALPPCDSSAQCLGILYVIEGSSLGAQIISRHYGEALGLSPARGLRYFTGYGPETGPMWRVFLDCLETEFARRPLAAGEVIESACATFRSYSDFIPSKV